VLQLASPTKVRLIQVMSHQCKIASKVELYTYLPKDSQMKIAGEAPSDLKFSKIGYFFFNSNEATNFQSRELKTVYVDVVSTCIKFVLHKCHVNKLNIFNQVGIIAISIFGEKVPLGNANQASKPEKTAFQELEYNMQFDEETLNRLRMLEKARDKAEKNEDYSEAKKLNEAIADLKRVGVHLQKLEERKAIAVRNKDYDSAIILKKVCTR
jgi:centrosomal protein CEP104